MSQPSIPWVERYRPTSMENVILSEENRSLFCNILNNNTVFPNMLFYGPPGTGKTTTIINLINEYQRKHTGYAVKNNIMMLNASDDRGIDSI